MTQVLLVSLTIYHKFYSFSLPLSNIEQTFNDILNMKVAKELPKWNAYVHHNLIRRVMEGDPGAVDASQTKLDYK